jgi:formylglycine-generating enzyme required for sulfatase activity
MKSSPVWTRTKNLPVNSRLLCQLSYGGMQHQSSRVIRGPPWRPEPQYMTPAARAEQGPAARRSPETRQEE